MIGAIARLPHVLKYIDMPLQHINDEVLDAMRRKTSRKLIETLLGKLRARVPGMTIRTTFITGFPGETDADFQATCSLVRRLPFKNNFIFKYSPRPGTVAIDRYPDDVPDEVKRWRNNTLLALQAETSARVHAEWVGRTVPVLFDSVRAREGGAAAVAPGGVTLHVQGQRVDGPRTGPGAGGGWQAVGRTPGDLIVAVGGESEAECRALLGTQIPVKLRESRALLLLGARAPAIR
jgi:tRNA A37 methylthiotransferase MiaB